MDLLSIALSTECECRVGAQGASEVVHCLGQRDSRQRSLPRLYPVIDSAFSQSGPGEVKREQFWFVCYALVEASFKGIGDLRVKLCPFTSEERIVGRILHQCVLEGEARIRWCTTLEEQTRCRQLV